jgi:hypothetical protein
MMLGCFLFTRRNIQAGVIGVHSRLIILSYDGLICAIYTLHHTRLECAYVHELVPTIIS